MHTVEQPYTLPEYAVNTLYDNVYFTHALPKELTGSATKERTDSAFARAQAMFAGRNLLALNESQLEHCIIRPLLNELGWHALPQETKKVHGKTLRPDWTLFADKAALDSYQAMPKDKRQDYLEGITTFCEVKEAGKSLDTLKANKGDNPFLQLTEYLDTLHFRFGFLTNGAHWWFVDTSDVTAGKRYIDVDLERIIADGSADAFHWFYALFCRDRYVSPDGAPTAFEQSKDKDNAVRLESITSLRSMVYGEGNQGKSVFEDIGRAILAAGDAPTLSEVYENSLYLVFRLLFIAFFEDRHWQQLSTNTGYEAFSLRTIYDSLKNTKDPKKYTGWMQLQSLFETLNAGSTALHIPLLNGGLFDPARASLLTRPKVLTNAVLFRLLQRLLFTDPGDETTRRDFRALSVTQLGSVYEGLLEYEFRIAAPGLHYLEYSSKETKNKVVSGYYDAGDAAAAKASKGYVEHACVAYTGGELYLASSRNNRKASASYFTPESLARPLVRRAIDRHIASQPAEASLLDLRILDNACGSGHILIEALNHLTTRALERLGNGQDGKLRAALDLETQNIRAALADLELEDQIAVDEYMVLRRILLKKTIYGVDLQPFAVELAHLSLWIETFVFGTPLSLIAHHVKAGNALMGATIEQFGQLVKQSGIFNMDIGKKTTALAREFEHLNSIQDTTAAKITESKALYRDSIVPVQAELNRLLDLATYVDLLHAEGRSKEAKNLIPVFAQQAAALQAEPECVFAHTVGALRQQYRFFNWEIEFPEAFVPGSPDQGFHIIVGNPPWDKTQFEDPLFFSQFVSEYRTLPNSKKEEKKINLLDIPQIRERYTKQKEFTDTTNAYYQDRYADVCQGKGDLYRFFVARNLTLLAPGGSLNYVLPTALMTDDGSAALRERIFANYTITAFDAFENRQGVFADIHRSYKYGLIQIVREANADQAAQCRFMLTDPAELDNPDTAFAYPLHTVRILSPAKLAYMEVGGGQADIDLLGRLYHAFPTLNPKWLDFRQEMNATLDKAIFHEDRKPGYIPLYKGASIWQYESDFTQGQHEYMLDPEEFDDYLRDTEINRIIDDIAPTLPNEKGRAKIQVVLKELWLRNKEDLAAFVQPERAFYRLAFRGIASDTNERTLVSALLPKNIGAQHSMWMSIPKKYAIDTKNATVYTVQTDVRRVLFAQALFNAVVFDWLIRVSTSINVTKSILQRIPLPQPDDAELTVNPVYAQLVRQSALLSIANDRTGFAELQEELGIADKDLPKTDKQKMNLRISNDVLVAGLYGVGRADMEHILASFKVMNNKHPEYGPALLAKMPNF